MWLLIASITDDGRKHLAKIGGQYIFAALQTLPDAETSKDDFRETVKCESMGSDWIDCKADADSENEDRHADPDQ